MTTAGHQHCKLPEGSMNYSVITSGNSSLAHTVYRGLAIGGALFDAVPSQTTVVNGKSTVETLMLGGNWNFNEGVIQASLSTILNFSEFEVLAQTAIPLTVGQYKVVRTSGSTFLWRIRTFGQEARAATMATPW